MKHLEKFIRRMQVSGTLTLKTALHIGNSSTDEKIGATDMQVIKTISGEPFIPGSSFKGVARSFLESVFGEIKNKNTDEYPFLSCNSAKAEENCLSEKEIKKIKKTREFEKEILKKTCYICKLFGSKAVGAKIKISDMPVKKDGWFDKFEKRDGVVIDRDNETAVHGKKYDFEAVPAGTQFEFKVSIENYEDYEAGLLMLIIENVNNGNIHLGGKTSRGLGRCDIQIDTVKIITAEDVVKRSEGKVYSAGNAEKFEIESISEKSSNDIFFKNAFEALKKILADSEHKIKSNEATNKLPELMKKYGWTKDKIVNENYGKNWSDFVEKANKKKYITIGSNGIMEPVIEPVRKSEEKVKTPMMKTELDEFIDKMFLSLKDILPESKQEAE